MKQYLIVNMAAQIPELLIYGYIGAEYEGGVTASDFANQLKQLEANNAVINIRINSPGGSVFEGFAIYNAIKRSPAVINTYVDGIAASMASVIAMAGKKVYISSVGRMMTHQASSTVYGKSTDLHAAADLIESLNKNMSGIYSAKTGMDEAACATTFLGANDTWFTAEQAVACKLADEIYSSSINVTAVNTTDITALWGSFNNSLKITNPNMATPLISAASLTVLNLTAEATLPQIEAAIAALNTKLTGETARANNAESALNAYKQTAETAALETLINGALEGKKINQQQAAVYRTTFAGNSEGLKALLEVTPAYTGLVAAIGNSAATDQAELAELLKLDYKTLDRQDKAQRLKALDRNAFAAKYQAYYGKPYKGE